MKIAFIVNVFPCLSETFILNQITGLLESGNDVDIIAWTRSEEKTMHEEIITHRLVERTRYFNIPNKKIHRVFLAIRILIVWFLRHPLVLLKCMNFIKYKDFYSCLNNLFIVRPFLGKRYDIIQCHFGPNGVIGTRLKQLGIPGKVVTMFHGYDIRLGIERGGSIYRELFEHCDTLLAISDYNYNHLKNWGAKPEKVIFHPVGIDLKKFQFKYTRNSCPREKPINILTVARLVEEKGLTYGIQAIAKIVENNNNVSIEYNIIGDGPLRDILLDLVADFGLNGIVHLVGPRVQEEIVEAMQNHDLYLLPSIAEVLPVVLMEASAVGLPIVATNVGSVSEIVIDGKSGFIVPERNVDALAQKLEFLMKHPQMWPEMGRCGRDHVEKHYDIRKLNQNLVEIYQNILE